MTVGFPSVDSRLLGPAQTLTGADGDALANLVANKLPNGALCWVIAEDSLYRFAKHSLEAPDGTRVIPTSRGTGSPGRWVQVTGNSGSIASLPTLIWVSADFTGTPTGSIAAPYPTIQQAIDAVTGAGATILVTPGMYPDAWSVPSGLTVNIFGEGFSQGGPGGGVNIAGPTLTSSAVRLQNVALTSNTTLVGIGVLFCFNVVFDGHAIVQSGAGGWTLRMSTDGLDSSEPGAIQCAVLIAEDMTFTGAISVSSTLVRLLQCTMEGSLTFTGAAGVLLTDLYTLNTLRDNGTTVTNSSTIQALDAPTRAFTIASPIFATAGIQTVAVAIADARPGDTFAVTNTTALPTNVALGAPRCTSSGIVAITLIAVDTALGANVDIRVTHFNGSL